MTDINKCPKCGSYSLYVVDSRKIEGSILRRRSCADCGRRNTTREISVEDYERLTGKAGESKKTEAVIVKLRECLSVLEEQQDTERGKKKEREMRWNK